MGNKRESPTSVVTLAGTPTDEAQQLRAARADLTLFAPIYESYFDRVHAYCRYRVGTADAEDVTGEVFIRALTHLEQYHGGSVGAWLFRIAHNCVIDQLRYRRPQVALEEVETMIASADIDALEVIAQAEQCERIDKLVAGLKDEQIHLLTLKMVGGLTAVEIAETIGKSPGAVRVELHRIIQHLRSEYRKLEQKHYDQL